MTRTVQIELYAFTVVIHDQRWLDIGREDGASDGGPVE